MELQPSLSRAAAIKPSREDGTVAFPVTITAGTPAQIGFVLDAFRDAGGNNGAHGTGSIVFRSLPAGARVTSCKGYGTDATRSRATSGGTLKVLER